MMIELQKVLDFTGKEEGLRLKTYKCPAGKDTIGYGHNLTDNGLNQSVLDTKGLQWDGDDWDWNTLTISEDVARAIFEIDVKYAYNTLLYIFPAFETFSENRQIALIDMMFNMGATKFRGFKNMINAIKLNLWHVAASEAKNSNWYRQVTNRADRVIAKLKDG